MFENEKKNGRKLSLNLEISRFQHAATWRRVALPHHHRVRIQQLLKLKFRCSGLVRSWKNTNHILNVIGNDISNLTVKSEFPLEIASMKSGSHTQYRFEPDSTTGI